MSEEGLLLSDGTHGSCALSLCPNLLLAGSEGKKTTFGNFKVSGPL